MAFYARQRSGRNKLPSYSTEYAAGQQSSFFKLGWISASRRRQMVVPFSSNTALPEILDPATENLMPHPRRPLPSGEGDPGETIPAELSAAAEPVVDLQGMDQELPSGA